MQRHACDSKYRSDLVERGHAQSNTNSLPMSTPPSIPIKLCHSVFAGWPKFNGVLVGGQCPRPSLQSRSCKRWYTLPWSQDSHKGLVIRDKNEQPAIQIRVKPLHSKNQRQSLHLHLSIVAFASGQRARGKGDRSLRAVWRFVQDDSTNAVGGCIPC